MTSRRWIADEFTATHATLTGAHADHLTRVLRARVGQEFDIVAGSQVRRGRIARIDRSHVEFELGDEIPAAANANVTVALSIFKFDGMEWAIEKCTELGVARIVPIIAQRTSPHLAAAAPKRMPRWQRIAHQSSEQSRRISPPEFSSPMTLAAAVALPGSTRIVLAESEQTLMLKNAMQLHPLNEGVVLALGPEGGWTEPELDSFREAGWTHASLGSTILRAETAAIAAVAIVLSELQA